MSIPLDLRDNGGALTLNLNPATVDPNASVNDLLLIVDHVSISKMPAVLSVAATSIGATSAQLNGEVLDDGL
jgi:hypothetical protein